MNFHSKPVVIIEVCYVLYLLNECNVVTEVHHMYNKPNT